MGGKYTESQKKASQTYQKKFSAIKFYVNPVNGERYREHARRRGLSIKDLCISLLEEDIARYMEMEEEKEKQGGRDI